MTQTKNASRDPVCRMDVDETGSFLSTTYRGRAYHFCCRQCLERFNQIPTLYIGGQGIPNIEPLAKRRRLRFVGAGDVEVGNAIRCVGEMMGVSSVEVLRGCLVVVYDLREVTLSQIEAVATAEGLAFKGGFHGLRRGLWRFEESNEVENQAIRERELAATARR